MSMEFPDDLSERNTKPNGLRIYQLNRALALLSQQNDPLTLYYAKMKKIWDELRALEGAPQCTCGVLSNCTCNLSKRLEELDSRRKLIQFLMGLNSRYDEALRKQVLAMDPLPSVGRAYWIILQAEKQNKVADWMNMKHELKAQDTCLDAAEASTGGQSYDTALVDTVCQQVFKALQGMQIGLPVNSSSSAPTSNIFTGDSLASSTPFVFGISSSSSSDSSSCSSSPFVIESSSSGSAAPIFSFSSSISTTTSNAPSPSQPVFGSNVSTPTFGFGSTSAPSGNNDQMSMEDSMAEDSMQAPTATATPAPVFGQSPIAAPPSGGFVFGGAPSPSPSAAPGFMSARSGNSFQFGRQPNQMPNPSAFQPTGSVVFHAGSAGSFSLGSRGGDKANRRIVKVKSKMRRK